MLGILVLDFPLPSKRAVVVLIYLALLQKMYYDTVSGDLDEAGHYKLQAKIIIPTSGTFYTDMYDFQTHCNL